MADNDLSPPPPPPAALRAVFDGGDAFLRFAHTGHQYKFSDPSLLVLALATKPEVGGSALSLHNQDLALEGDAVIRAFCRKSWVDRGSEKGTQVRYNKTLNKANI